MAIIPQYTQGNHYNAFNGKLHRFGNATCFIFRVIVPLLPSDEQNKIFHNKFDKTRQREF